MATKTTSKTAAKTPAARKATSVSKTAAPKAKVATKKKEPETRPAAARPTPRTLSAPVTKPSSAAKPAAAEPSAPPAPKRPGTSVSLIDKPIPAKKSEDGDIKKKTTVLPPISRIRASMEAPPVVSKPA